MHDGNFVMDGMVLPDDTPTPGLAEFAAVNAPIVFACDGPTLRIRNRYHSRRPSICASSRSSRWTAPVAEATLAVPAIPAGDRAEVDRADQLTAGRAGRARPG